MPASHGAATGTPSACLAVCRTNPGARYLDSFGPTGAALPDAGGYVVGRLDRPLWFGRTGGTGTAGRAAPMYLWLDLFAN